MSKALKDKIFKILIEEHNLQKKDIADAMALQKKAGISLGKAMIEKELIKEHDLIMVMVQEMDIPFINLNQFKIDPSLKDIISERMAKQYHIMPLAALQYTMTIAVSDPFDVFAQDDLKNITGKEIGMVIGTESDISKTIEAYYGAHGGESITDISKDIQAEDFEIISEQEGEEDIDGVLDESDKAPIIRMINLIIKEALIQKASDIHIEPNEEGLRVRYRIDGVLQEILNIPKENQNAIIVRIKIMSQLDITSSQSPQDGRFKLKVSNKEVDFRVSLLPTTWGQKVVMRILDKGNLSVGLDGLGISEKPLEIFKEAIRKPFGMVLVTGPTGSGKSTTLYSIIAELNTVERNIITVEDPVEYLIDGLTQIQARAEIGLTFAEGLRAMLRQSPDIVMVGEIRDGETADIAIKASLTGQMVFSTLHTNDAPGALTRLIDMGVEPFLVSSSLVLISAQRLCRKICPHCKEEEKVTQETLDRIGCEIKAGTVFYKGKGCEACGEKGYSGRMSVTEVLDVDEDIRNMLLDGSSSDEIKSFACKEKGMDTLWDDAMNKCLAGLTTLEEVLRVATH